MGSTCSIVANEKAEKASSDPADLSKSFLSSSRMPVLSRGASVTCSIVLQALVISAILLVPVWSTNALDLKSFTQTLLVTPPPPPAPAAPREAKPVPRARPVTRPVFAMQAKLLLPRRIPKQVAMVREAPLPDLGVREAPGKATGGPLNGVLGGLLGATSPAVPVAPPVKPIQHKPPLQVGGNVKAPRALFNPGPVYPPSAMQDRVQGDVVISATIDVRGNVVKMKAVSGPSALIPAALAALAQWRFEPTYLDGEPWPVKMNVTFHFQLSTPGFPAL